MQEHGARTQAERERSTAGEREEIPVFFSSSSFISSKGDEEAALV